MRVVGGVVAVVFEPVPGVSLAAVWDGGQLCHIHVVDGGAWGPVLEHWDMWDRVHDGPQIECTPAALQSVVQFRLEDDAAVRELVALAEVCLCPLEHVQQHRFGVPHFSAN